MYAVMIEVDGQHNTLALRKVTQHVAQAFADGYNSSHSLGRAIVGRLIVATQTATLGATSSVFIAST